MPLLQNPEKYFYHRDEVYEGVVTGDKNNIVKVGDAVLDWNEGILKVVSVHPMTYVPTLQVWNPIENVDIDNEEASLITGLSGYQPTIISRAFYHTVLGVHYITLDSAYRIFGSDPTKCKIFLGTDTTNTGTIISNPQLIDLVSINSPTDTQKVVPTSVINIPLLDGQIITLIIYTDTGTKVGEKSFVVKESSAMAPATNSFRTIQDVQLYDCPWISLITPDQLEIPANYGMQIGTTQAIVNYTSGPPSIIPIDGTICKLLGVDNFNNNLAGITSYLTLVYTPQGTDLIENGNLNGQVTHTYQVITTNTNVDNRYKVYLSIYYNPTTQMYGFRCYLSDFDYNELILLDPNHYTVRDDDGNPVSLSRSWHVNNGDINIVIRVDMSKVFPNLYSQYFFVQQLNLDLNDVTIYSHSWYLDYDPTHTVKLDGIFKFHTNQSNNYEDLEMKGGANNYNEWIARFFTPIFPITGVTTPTPTHFKIRYFESTNNTVTYESNEIPIGDYSIPLNTPGNLWRDKSMAEIIWLKDNPGYPKYQLGVTPVVINAVYA